MFAATFFDGDEWREGVLDADGGRPVLRDAPPTAGMPRLDGALIGGFTDHHVHLQLVDHTLLAGSTLGRVVDLGAEPSAIASLAAARGVENASASGSAVENASHSPVGDAVSTPHLGAATRRPVGIEYAGAFLTPPGGYPSDRDWAPQGSFRELASADDAQAAVHEMADAGASCIKVASNTAAGPVFDDGLFEAIVASAHALALPVVAHAEGRGEAQRAARLGADRLAHAPFTERLTDDEIAAQAASVSWISTLSIHGGADLHVALDNVRRFHAAGGTVLYGTDMGNGPTPVGVNPRELEALHDAGVVGTALLRALAPRIRATPTPCCSCCPPSTPPHRSPVPSPSPTWRPDMTTPAAASALDEALLDRAKALDETDPLRAHVDAFVEAPGVTAYLDGNSLGRPLRDLPARMAAFVREDWGTRLIRSWDEQWMALPMELGDRIGRVALGAAPGQTVVADSTSVLIYKLMRAALRGGRGARGDGRTELVIETGNFPTDRFLADGVAAETGMTIRWLEADPVHGVRIDDVAAVLSERTALVSLSHVDYRSGALADMPGITAVVREAGALMMWDLCHTVGVIPMQLDEWGVDMAVGCTYKYLNGGPGSPAFAYLRREHQGLLRQPIQGWWSAADIFAMGREYVPADDIRQLLSGTPPVTSMLGMQGMLDLIEQATIDGVREKSRSLTDLAVRAYDGALAPLGVRLLSPRDAALRGGHVTIGHPDFREVTRELWADGVIPDFRFPDGIRLGLSPLSTSHVETVTGVLAVRDALASRVR